MSYTTNPNLPKVRAKAVTMVRNGMSIRQVAKYFGFNPSTISRWVKRAPQGNFYELATRSSRPKHYPQAIDWRVARRIADLRRKTKGRCSEVIHQMLLNENITVSLNTVKRTLRRQGLIKPRSPWKKYHLSGERPEALKPGDLVQVDTIHLWLSRTERIYVYTLIDVYSRWVYAYATKRISGGETLKFIKQAKRKSKFDFSCIQSDHGPEFSKYFTHMVKTRHRHIRVRKPNDNAHIERFNRTIQQELLNQLPKDVRIINGHLKAYLRYYNQERLHLGINLQTPSQILERCCQGAG
jgi:transposase InsO family protein